MVTISWEINWETGNKSSPGLLSVGGRWGEVVGRCHGRRLRRVGGGDGGVDLNGKEKDMD
jgi:hypothetical protein